MLVNYFKTSIIIKDTYKEPNFDMSVPMNCKIVGNDYIVGVYDVSEEKLAELKSKYEWIEEKDVPRAKTPQEIINGV